MRYIGEVRTPRSLLARDAEYAGSQPDPRDVYRLDIVTVSRDQGTLAHVLEQILDVLNGDQQ